jgi:hypothetical protein
MRCKSWLMMAVIKCPSCKQKISDKAKSCTHCLFDLSGMDAEKMATIKQVDYVKKSQSLMNHSFIAMLLFCGGFLALFYREDVSADDWQHNAALASTIAGFVLYLVTRVRLIMLKRNR